jgi:hypothetical protein
MLIFCVKPTLDWLVSICSPVAEIDSELAAGA